MIYKDELADREAGLDETWSDAELEDGRMKILEEMVDAMLYSGMGGRQIKSILRNHGFEPSYWWRHAKMFLRVKYPNRWNRLWMYLNDKIEKPYFF